MTQVQPGMTIDQVREIFTPRADAKTKLIMNRYRTSREKSGHGNDRAGLGVYSVYQSRAAKEKVLLAASLLEKAGLEVTRESLRSITALPSAIISAHWSPPKDD